MKLLTDDDFGLNDRVRVGRERLCAPTARRQGHWHVWQRPCPALFPQAGGRPLFPA